MAYPVLGDLKDKKCVITGGTGGIGSSLVACLARNGVVTAILSRKEGRAVEKAEEIAAATGGTVIGIRADVLDKKSLDEAKRTVNDRLGSVDILINAAGGNSAKATTAAETIEEAFREHLDQTFFGLELDAFRQVFDLNFTGTLLPIMVFGRDMVACKKGVILNISSMNSYRPLTKIPAYSAAKASINNLTQWLAVHFAPQNIRVNAMAPGFLVTDQNRYLLYDQKTGELSNRGKKIIEATPMKRFGTPGELEGTLLYLVSDMSRFVTGTVLPVDGGFNVFAGV
ncbi:MAG: SDR family oxidoreductase [Chitinispirillaceae bacterium]|nr:SDR family oxidoreductase [Chitinispirillaceae bacterium]